MVTLIYHRPLDERWRDAADALRRELGIDLIGRARKQKWCLGRDHIDESLQVNDRHYTWRQPEGTFTQPNAVINSHMLTWLDQLVSSGDDGNLLELYCGNGNFTVVLARHFARVLATEVSKPSVAAARHNLASNGIDNVAMVRMSSAEFAQAWRGERPFRRLRDVDLANYGLDTLLVDPPRAGLDQPIAALATQFRRLYYISCNPHSLAANLRALNGTHRVEAFALFDQFPYTDHVECGVALVRRTPG